MDRHKMITRVLTIMTLLGERSGSTPTELKQILRCHHDIDVCVRTVKRDLKALEHKTLARRTPNGWCANFKLTRSNHGV